MVSLFYCGLKLGSADCNCLWFSFFFSFLFSFFPLKICVPFTFWLSLRFSWTSINNCHWAITFCNELPYSQRCMSSGPVHWYTFMLFRLFFFFFFWVSFPLLDIFTDVFFTSQSSILWLVFQLFFKCDILLWQKYKNCKKQMLQSDANKQHRLSTRSCKTQLVFWARFPFLSTFPS